MILIVDIGNTKTKLVWFKNNKPFQSAAFINTNFREFSAQTRQYPFTSGIISSVKPVSVSYKKWAKKNHLFFLSHNSELPIKNLYLTPHTLGNDRLAAVMGAQELYPQKNILIIDAGTCITYDILTAKKEYLGGAISPGIYLRLKALHTFTGKLPLVNAKHKIYNLTGNNTQSSILSGVYNGTISEIDSMINKYHSVYKNLTVILTGGDAPYFEKALKNRIFARPELVITGLYKIFTLNNGK
ncbi:MAG: type III pantothenate kinase [Bacteroidetes bacterium]|nr:type III pantothenate kinase [Bacteroidota bacterium]MBV6461100.1 Type III pantothenate kinase [Flavobacteriales bacterium]WKZ75503.1 MAG: type III pantothenate kinase [Vicingaceae bacterium]MCL4815070.1 type III pantothenate kinase [Flavobacteriales bacterium]NOG94823.1 type III pantothenate kinase [Bacteroidota bacterium]